MHRKLMILSIAFALFASCNTTDNKTKTPDSASSITEKPASSANCYQYAGAGDTITLKVVRTGETVSGTLVYNLNGKDKNTGTIQGNMDKDLLLADYTFSSEGMQSVRQVAFRWSGDSFVEGYGDVDSKDNKVHFKNVNSLQFNESMKLTQAACQ